MNLIYFIKLFATLAPETGRDLRSNLRERLRIFKSMPRTHRKVAVQAMLAGVLPAEVPLWRYLAGGAKASDVAPFWKLTLPGAASAAEVARRFGELSDERYQRMVEDILTKMAYEAGLTEDGGREAPDEVYIDRDAWDMLMSLSPDSGEKAVRQAFGRVKAARRQQALEEGAETIADFLWSTYDLTNGYRLPDGWRWARPGDEEFLAQWVHKTNACLLRVLAGDFPCQLAALALGPDHEVVGFSLYGPDNPWSEEDLSPHLRCPVRAWACDRCNRADARAYAWAREGLFPDGWEELLDPGWEDEVADRLLAS